MPGDMMAFVVVMVLFGVPVLGLTARFALKPIVESIVRLRESFDQQPPGSDLAALRYELTSLRSDVQELKESMQRLEEGSRFFTELRREEEAERLAPGRTT